MFRVGILNYFIDDLVTDHVGSYIPTLLRVGGLMQAPDITPNNGIAFFFDRDKIVISETYLSPMMPLLPTECGSPISTGIVCRYYKSRTIIPSTLSMHENYYPGLNAIIVGGNAVTPGVEFNYYIPV